MIRPDEIDLDTVVAPKPGVEVVETDLEGVLVDGWRQASVVNLAAVLTWSRLDGTRTLEEIAAELSGLVGVDRATVAGDVVDFARSAGRLGYLDGVDPRSHDGELPVTLVPLPVPEDVGDTVDDLVTVDLDGNQVRLLGFEGRSCVLVNWSPHCGYCASILGDLAALEEALRAARTDLVLLAYGSAESSSTQAELSGWHPRVLFKPPDAIGPFVGHGTPSALHLDATGILLNPAARGGTEVLDLVARLAGVATQAPSEPGPADGDDGARTQRVRYLLERGGACPAGAGSEPVTRWVGTRVYRIGDHHVGLRCVTGETGEILDRLLSARVVDDPHAGHIFTLALSDEIRPEGPPPNLLCLGSNVLVRSRSPRRVMRALLWQLGARMDEFDSGSGLVQVTATAVHVNGGIVLLPPGLHGLEEHLQPAFARYGVSYVDVPYPEVDLERAEVVVPEPGLPHDETVLAAAGPAGGWPDESAPVAPGRYPLVGWGALFQAERSVTRFTPAQAAAAVVSNVMGLPDAPSGVRRLVELFGRVPGFGLWYGREHELADAVAEALGLGPA